MELREPDQTELVFLSPLKTERCRVVQHVNAPDWYVFHEAFAYGQWTQIPATCAAGFDTQPSARVYAEHILGWRN